MKEVVVKLCNLAGSFAENKDIAKKIRIEEILPALERRDSVIVDFDGVSGATQSFVHALLADPIRQYGDFVFDNVYYRNTNDEIAEVLSMVYHYMQESLSDPGYL